MSKKSFSFVLFTIVLPLTLISLVLFHYQSISDYVKLLDYEPPARIAQIRDDIKLTAKGETLFYVHDPQIVDSETFSVSCPVYEQTIVLGCYFTNTSIFLYDVEDSRSDLQGVEEVTAAHEILHAAYDRLNTDEKDALNDLLQSVYESLADDSKIKQNIDEYASQGDAVVKNELHSIIGTEVRELPQELEEYYAQYFEDRSVIVDIAESYSEIFRSLEREIAEYDSQLTSLSEAINTLEAQIVAYQNELQRQYDELDALRDSPSQYNQRVDSYNALVRTYNVTIEEYTAKTDEYNEIVKKRNSISAEQRTLYDAIDARVEDIES